MEFEPEKPGFDSCQDLYELGMCGNRISVFKNPNQSQKVKPKFWFPWLFTKLNLSYTNSPSK